MKYLILLSSLLLLAGCQSQPTVKSNADTIQANPTAREGDSTLSGKVVQSGDTFSLVDSTGKQTELDSYKIDLTPYANKQVSITGQFSGDTLFAAKVVEK
ncbi:MAG: hypothetical protein ABI425_03170 [Patescibacteria group bacterium]